MNTNSTTTKVTQLTFSNIGAMKAHVEALQVTLGATVATFEGTPAAALARLKKVHAEIVAAHGGRNGGAMSLHAVMRKLEKAAKATSTTPTDEQRKAALAKATPAKKLGDMTPEERGAAVRNAADALQTELTANAPKLSLVLDSTDKSQTAKGVFGKSVKDAVAEERIRRTAMQAADKALEAAGYSKTAQADKPTWGTAKMHGLKTGDMVLFYGTDPKAPKAAPTVRKYNAKKPELWGTPANRFWAAQTALKAGLAPATKAAPAKPEKLDHSAAGTDTKPASLTKKAAPSKPAPVMQDGIAFGTSGPACHALKVGDKFLFHGTDRKAGPVKTGHKLTLQITDRIWIEGVDSKGKVGMRVHIAKPFWAKKA